MVDTVTVGPGGGPGSLSEWSARASQLSERVRVDLGEAMLETGQSGGFRVAAELLVSVAKGGKSMRARVRAADALLRHATKIASIGTAQVVTQAVQVNVAQQNAGPVHLPFASLLPTGGDAPRTLPAAPGAAGTAPAVSAPQDAAKPATGDPEKPTAP